MHLKTKLQMYVVVVHLQSNEDENCLLNDYNKLRANNEFMLKKKKQFFFVLTI